MTSSAPLTPRHWAMLLLPLAAVGVVATLLAGNVTTALIIAGGACALTVWQRWPSGVIDALIIVTITTMPAGVPSGVRAGVYIYFYEVVLAAAVVYCIGRLRDVPGLWKRMRSSPTALLLVAFAGTLVIAAARGFLAGHPIRDIQYEIRPTIGLLGAVFVAAVVIATGAVRRYLPAVFVSLTVSAVLMAAASTVGLKLSGREENAQLFTTTGRLIAGGSDASRILTQTTSAALTVTLLCISLLVLGTPHRRLALLLMTPALIVTFFSFSRNALLGLGLVIAFLFVVAVLRRAVVQFINRMVVGVLAVVLTAIIAFFGLSVVGAGGWAATQVSGYTNRVFSGFEESTRAVDSSTQDRELENQYLLRGIEGNEILGNGLGFRYKPASGPPDEFAAQDGQLYAHNYYGWLFVKAGMFGVLALALMILSCVVPILSGRWRDPTTTAVGATLAGLAAVLVVSPMPNDLDGSLVFGAVVGFVVARYARQNLPVARPEPEPSMSGRG